MILLTLDLETIPGQTEAAREQAKLETRPPGTLKKPESIETWWAEQGEAAIEEQWRKQALDPALGEVCAVGFALGETAPVESLVRGLDETERDFLRRVLAHIKDELRQVDHWQELVQPFVVCHNAAFDLAFLRARLWANRLWPPHWLPKPDARQGRDYGDTMHYFAGYGGKIALSKLCRCLGIPDPKAETQGAEVLNLWTSGDHERLARYNQADVEATRAAWLIMAQSAECEVVA